MFSYTCRLSLAVATAALALICVQAGQQAPARVQADGAAVVSEPAVVTGFAAPGDIRWD
ncbi:MULTISPECIES: hypothetical protein [unclassified Streptomyces]|uniref:hypothetical protein n=1 Tax=unclassified Streptomyces TaxID=2593676 RepID=UPI0022565B8C|nr:MULTISPECIES: hypothetical protein [unclassified Streptomyces]MCX4527013.1 hypothetical protein [Streptomyces sp. NBC_01551]MCX4542427.1 hypothetical protein [Streptomyces sp. NBC_01565]